MVSPQIAPGTLILSPVAAIRHSPEGPTWAIAFHRTAALQAGRLSALLASISLLLTSQRASARRSAAVRLDRDARKRLNGKRPTPARLRALPPLPAQPPRTTPRIRLVWPPATPSRRSRPASA